LVVFFYTMLSALVRKGKAADNPWGEGGTKRWNGSLAAAVPPVRDLAARPLTALRLDGAASPQRLQPDRVAIAIRVGSATKE
jgi:hypothetical protein